MKLTAVTIRGISLLPTTDNIYPKFTSLGQLHMQTKLLGIIDVNFDV